MIQKSASKAALLNDFYPKSIACFRERYSITTFFQDLCAGVTIGVISLPLAMAFAIGAGVSPEKGLYTAIVAGFIISLLGGSRVQIGGPTGAYVVIVYGVIQKHGYEGLALATILAGGLLILMGVARCGFFLKFIPSPVIIGMTCGLALCIFTSQLRDFFGLCIEKMPVDFLGRWAICFQNAHSANRWAFVLAAATLAAILFLRYRYPKIPGTILAVIAATLAATLFHLPVETIQTKFGGIPHSLPEVAWPSFSFEKVRAVFPDAFTIALLGAIESLLSAMISDKLAGHRHHSNCELIAQGCANIGSSLYGGIPASGAIARTIANVKLGGKTPVSGMIHAVTLLMLMMIFASWASQIPLSALSGVLVFVAWNMCEFDHVIKIIKGSVMDTGVLLVTFLLTVMVDLTVAVPVGSLLAGAGVYISKRAWVKKKG